MSSTSTTTDKLSAYLRAQARERLRQGIESLLQHADQRVRNAGVSSADRALNYATTRLQDILVTDAPELISVDLGGNVIVFELDEISPPAKNDVGPPASDCWDVEIAFFNPESINAARVVIAQTIDVSDVVPHLVEAPKKYRRR